MGATNCYSRSYSCLWAYFDAAYRIDYSIMYVYYEVQVSISCRLQLNILSLIESAHICCYSKAHRTIFGQREIFSDTTVLIFSTALRRNSWNGGHFLKRAKRLKTFLESFQFKRKNCASFFINLCWIKNK